MNEVAEFFRHWSTYRAVIETDSMDHRAVYGAVHDILAERTEPYALLDLGCGDAAGTGPAVAGTAISRYVGVDLAEPALAYAAATMADCGARVDLRVGDLHEAVRDQDASYDVILASFALHHLATDDKRDFLASARDRLAPGGELLLVDVVRLDGQTREEYLDRYAELVDSWPVPSPTKADILAHVRGADFPEEVSVQPAWARELGYTRVESFYAGVADTQAGWRLGVG